MVESFWKTQPVKKGKTTKIISKPINTTTERHKLKEDLVWKTTDDVHKITEFLKENYVEDEENLFRMYYSENFFKFLFADPNHQKEYSLSIVDSMGMAGYILAKEHELIIKGIEQRVVSINFLCLRHDLRNMNLAPILIKEITRVANKFGIFHGVFTGHKDLGFSIVKSAYYHMVLDFKRLFDVGFIDTLSARSCDKYMISPGTVVASDEDLKSIYKKYCENLQKYEIYEKLSEEYFEYMFNNKNKVIHMLYNQERNEYASFFVIESYSIEKKSYFSTAYLYYWDGSYRIIEDVICYAKFLGISLFNVLDLNDNNKIIKEFEMLAGTGELWYHLYNWGEESISNEKVNFILF